MPRIFISKINSAKALGETGIIRKVKIAFFAVIHPSGAATPKEDWLAGWLLHRQIVTNRLMDVHGIIQFKLTEIHELFRGKISISKLSWTDSRDGRGGSGNKS